MPIQVTCPACSRMLRVPDNLLGQMVKCPACQNAFQASVNEGGAPPPAPEERVSSRPSKRERPPEDEGGRDFERDRERQRDREWDDRGDDRGRSRRRYSPHRGGKILAFGLIALLTGIWPLGLAAWIMDASDLKEIRSGRMDPAGESNTNVGYWLGIVSVIGWALGTVCCCGIGFMAGMAN